MKGCLPCAAEVLPILGPRVDLLKDSSPLSGSVPALKLTEIFEPRCSCTFGRTVGRNVQSFQSSQDESTGIFRHLRDLVMTRASKGRF